MTSPTMTTPPAFVPLGLTRDENGRFISHPRDPVDFWRRVDCRDLEGCWPWTGAIDQQTGYGRVSWEGRYWSTHRLAFVLSRGAIQKGKFVLHACDNRSCCKPEHLWLGTAKDNSEDAVAKDRMHPRERHGMAKLTTEDVQAIRRRWARGRSGADLARDFGVHRNTIYSIIRRQNWRTVK